MNRAPCWILSFESRERFLEALGHSSIRLAKDLDTFTPFDVPEVDQALGADTRVYVLAVATFLGGLSGWLFGFLLQEYSAAYDAPLNIGGRPLNSWPGFVPIVFILMILGAGLALTAAWFFHERLPQPWHPVFETESFDLSRDRFLIFLRAAEDGEEPSEQIERWRRELSPDHVEEIA